MKTFLSKQSWLCYHQSVDGGMLKNKYGFPPEDGEKLVEKNQMFYELYKNEWSQIKHKATASQVDKVNSIIEFCKFNEGTVNQYSLFKNIINEINSKSTVAFIQG